MSDKNLLTKIGESKLSRRSFLKWTGIASVPVIAGGIKLKTLPITHLKHHLEKLRYSQNVYLI